MIGTESKLWKRMTDVNAEGGWTRLRSLDRIESPITPGASDIVYSGRVNSGWIELKTASWPRAGRAFTLHSPFTAAQSTWLLSHHNPAHNQRSYLLLGIIGPRTWREFILFDARTAVALLQGRAGVPHEKLLKRIGVRQFSSMSDLIEALDEENGEEDEDRSDLTQLRSITHDS